MTRSEAVTEIHRRIALTKRHKWEWITITSELQAAANNAPLTWTTSVKFSVNVIEQWADEVERSIAAEIARKLTT